MSFINVRRQVQNLIALSAASLILVGAPAQADEYVALGDSAASGNGTGNPDLDYNCFRSSDAYAPIIASERDNTQLKFVACSGATTDDVVDSQIAALSKKTDFVTLSVGGNDVGFIELILNCGFYWDEWQCLHTADEIHRRIDEELPAKLDQAYAAIKKKASKATIMNLGYPRFFGSDVSCWTARGITSTEAEALNGISDHLDRVIAGRAAQAGIIHLSVIEQFTGHDVCAADPFVMGKDVTFLRDVYHPSKAGYRDGHMPLIRAIME
ncbi:SGNH/GDSL hydrolase family protein [Marinobacter sp.]|uniref:SGNH/GDSL hydrolase family protein n=1 Tax=Marinobacter sp. TaxID=50741 RepID=UPI0034A5BDA2